MKCQYIENKSKCGKPAPWRSFTGTMYCDKHMKILEKIGMRLEKIKAVR